MIAEAVEARARLRCWHGHEWLVNESDVVHFYGFFVADVRETAVCPECGACWGWMRPLRSDDEAIRRAEMTVARPFPFAWETWTDEEAAAEFAATAYSEPFHILPTFRESPLCGAESLPPEKQS